MTLSLRFWGTRGSIPTPGRATVRYGGNTPCAELRTDDDALIIFDAGTGARELGQALADSHHNGPITGDIFLSHAHWDHIQGLPFFAPIFQHGNRFRIWSAPELTPKVERAVREQMSSVVFPVSFDEIEATIEFCALEGAHEGAHAGASYVIDALPVRHPGGALGYRVRARNAAHAGLVYISDNELGDAPGYEPAAGWRDALVAFARGATVLVHDAMYTAAEYETHRGWGHSHYGDVVDLAVDAGVESLVLFHHNPARSDDALDAEVVRCREAARRRGATLRIDAAAEGTTLTI